MQRVLTDRGTEYFGSEEKHLYQVYLALNEIERTKTKVQNPQTYGICERFYQTCLNEFYKIAFGRKIYHTLEDLQAGLDVFTKEYNDSRTHQGRRC